MSELTVPRQQVVICALTGSALKMRREKRTFRIDPHDALERMLNGHDTYELTINTVRFTGEVDIEDPQIMSRLSPRP